MPILPKEILSEIAAKQIVVLSDRYPPRSFGGAELSLHNALSAADQSTRAKTLVILFDSDISKPLLYSIKQISVLCLPDAANWPFNSSPKHLHVARLRSIAYRHFLKYGWPLASIFEPKNFWRRIGALYLEVFQKPRGGVLSDFLIDRRDYRVGLLKKVLAATDCKRLVADNTRSIVIGSLAGAGIQSSVAIVRDNRFSCPRHNQIMMVNGKYCGACDLSCAAEDSKGSQLARRIQRSHLFAVKKFRAQRLASFNTVVVTSHFLARNTRALLGAEADIRRIPNPVGSLPELLTACRGVAESARNDILVVGMLNEAKGQLDLVRNAVRWLKGDSSLRLIFAGRGDRTKKAIQDWARKSGIEKQIHFLNYLDRTQTFRAMRSCKLVLLPTRWKEPFGRVPLEAAIARKPVVSFAVGGLCETIIDGYSGVLVEPLNYEKLFAACDRLLADGELRQRLGSNAFEHVVLNYADDKTSSHLMSVLSEAEWNLAKTEAPPRLVPTRENAVA
ncbi:glycosyltransferase family 4 protein [Rhizobium halophilum]|uniref:glycosyltransferase family 4 protein n=1 Tax=Rhizobium halophilum TaxID=2846852 RepID=UPI001EFDC0C4|nr:glycosyltransferase family 4 protein [Rhizobium halophilum]MCF6369491.1 glycosyltransferase family 4 protein [Rhizobium halophilum]